MMNVNKLDDQGRRRFMQACAASCLGVSAFPGGVYGKAAPTAKAKRMVFIFLRGGMSHVDSFDPKPENKEVMGPTLVINSNVDGIRLGHYFPGMAKHMDKCAVIRSMSSTQGAHAEGQYTTHTNYEKRGTIRHASLGSWIARMTQRVNPRLPANVVIHESPQGLGSSAGYMDSRFASLPIGDALAGLQHSSIPHGITPERQTARYDVAAAMNKKFLAANPRKDVRSYREVYAEALSLMKSEDLKAFDITLESEAVRKRYGDNPLGNGCLLARRLVEQDVRFVEVMHADWDHHGNISRSFSEMAPQLDQALSALIEDLHQRGLLKDTLVAVTTEFGRTPVVNAKGGRDHYPKCYSQLLAGAGLSGQVYGSSDDSAAEVTDKEVSIADFTATLGWAMGIAPDEEIISPSGRPFTLGHKGKPITSLF